MTRWVLSPRARSDLDEIWDYTAERWGLDQAERYIRAIQSAVESLAKDPTLGRGCDDIRPGYRKYPVGSHILFYRLTDEGLDVVRILHRRMDVERRL